MLLLRPPLCSRFVHRHCFRLLSTMEKYDAEQVRLMEEMCILVDPQDKTLGPVSKKDCHLMKNIRQGMLHRAFSVFLFDKNRLLLQQRASAKITFPDLWTNTCCSHPLYVPDEMEEAGFIGVKRAAQRKLEHELGIPKASVPLDALNYLTRIHYLAPSDGEWGEHEVDYIFVAQVDNVPLAVNANEVSHTKLVTKTELQSMFASPAYRFTPWFQLIAKSFLFDWWDTLSAGGQLQPDWTTIHRM